MTHCHHREWEQFEFLRDLPYLEELVFQGNPLEEEHSEDGTYNRKVSTDRSLRLYPVDVSDHGIHLTIFCV